MRTMLMSAALATMIAGVSAITAAPDQVRPGEPTKAEVWIQNRTKADAVAVTVQDFDSNRPVRVAVTNGDSSAGTPNPLRVQIVQPTWQYRTERIGANIDPASALSPLGAQGWEAAGTWTSVDGGTVSILLKRQR